MTFFKNAAAPLFLLLSLAQQVQADCLGDDCENWHNKAKECDGDDCDNWYSTPWAIVIWCVCGVLIVALIWILICCARRSPRHAAWTPGSCVGPKAEEPAAVIAADEAHPEQRGDSALQEV